MIKFIKRYNTLKSDIIQWLGIVEPNKNYMTNNNLTNLLELYKDWKIEYQFDYPIKYFITQKVIPFIADAVKFPANLYYTVECYYSNRFITKTHLLRSNLTIGDWCDYDTRLSNCVFDSFVHWMETESCNESNPNPSKMIDYYRWESNLIYDEYMGIDSDNPLYHTKTGQAKKAIVLFEIYEYIKYQRKSMLAKAEELLLGTDDYTHYNKLEIDIDMLDTEYLIRIINNRKYLWN